MNSHSNSLKWFLLPTNYIIVIKHVEFPLFFNLECIKQIPLKTVKGDEQSTRSLGLKKKDFIKVFLEQSEEI